MIKKLEGTNMIMIKKQQDHLIVIREEQTADNVFGDGYSGLASGSRFLNTLLGDGVCRRYDDARAHLNYFEIKRAWKGVGVDIAKQKYGFAYFIGGQMVSPKAAFDHALQVTGKHLEPADWCRQR